MSIDTVLRSMLNMSRIVPACAAYIHVPCSHVALVISVTTTFFNEHDERHQNIVVNCTWTNGAQEDVPLRMQKFCRHVASIVRDVKPSIGEDDSGNSTTLNINMETLQNTNITLQLQTERDVMNIVCKQLVTAARCVDEYKACGRCALEMLHPLAGDSGAYCSGCVQWAATHITRHFQRLLSDPSTHACRARLQREYEELCSSVYKQKAVCM